MLFSACKRKSCTKWILEQTHAEGPLAKVRAEAERLISILDAKPITRQCHGHNCKKPAVKFTAGRGGPSLYTWCETCDPYQAGAYPDKLKELRTYRKALEHVEDTCSGSKADYRDIIREMALAKGLPERCGEKRIEAFFTVPTFVNRHAAQRFPTRQHMRAE